MKWYFYVYSFYLKIKWHLQLRQNTLQVRNWITHISQTYDIYYLKKLKRQILSQRRFLWDILCHLLLQKKHKAMCLSVNRQSFIVFNIDRETEPRWALVTFRSLWWPSHEVDRRIVHPSTTCFSFFSFFYCDILFQVVISVHIHI